MAGAGGIEPTSRVLETRVLPLNDAPVVFFGGPMVADFIVSINPYDAQTQSGMVEGHTQLIHLTSPNMGIILWIIFGGLVGWIASMIMKTDAQQGALLNIVVGIVGAVIGGWVMSLLGSTGVTGFNLYSFLVALLGAVILIALVRALRR